MKSRVQMQLATAISTRDQGTKHRVQLVNKTHAIFNAHGIKIMKESPATKAGFERAVNSREWSGVELGTLKAITIQLAAIHEAGKSWMRKSSLSPKRFRIMRI